MKKTILLALSALLLSSVVQAAPIKNLAMFSRAGTAEIKYDVSPTSYKMEMVIDFSKYITELEGAKTITFSGEGSVALDGTMLPEVFKEEGIADFGTSFVEYKFDKKNDKIIRTTKIDTMEKDKSKNKAELGIVTEEVAEMSYQKNDFFTAIFGDPNASNSIRYVGDYKLTNIFLSRGGDKITFVLSNNTQVFVVKLVKTPSGYIGPIWLAKGTLL